MRYPEPRIHIREIAEQKPKFDTIQRLQRSYLAETTISVKIDLSKIYPNPYYPISEQLICSYLTALENINTHFIKVVNEALPNNDFKTLDNIKDWILTQIKKEQASKFDEDTGTIDTDRIATDTPATLRNKITSVREIIAELEEKLGKTIPIGDVLTQASAKGIEGGDVEEAIEKLKRAGDIYEVKRGFISRI
jgi:hypothetical protein